MKADQQTKSAAHRVTHYHLGDDAPFCGAKVKAPQLSSDEFEVTCKRCLHKPVAQKKEICALWLGCALLPLGLAQRRRSRNTTCLPMFFRSSTAQKHWQNCWGKTREAGAFC